MYLQQYIQYYIDLKIADEKTQSMAVLLKYSLQMTQPWLESMWKMLNSVSRLLLSSLQVGAGVGFLKVHFRLKSELGGAPSLRGFGSGDEQALLPAHGAVLGKVVEGLGHGGRERTRRLGEAFARQPPEGDSEVSAVESVDEWVDRRVDPA